MALPRSAPQGWGGGDDARLLERLQARDADALDLVFERYGRPCYSLARRIIADEPLAQDVVQEVFLTVWRAPERYDATRGGFGTWIMSMTHHKAVDAVRREESLRKRRTSYDTLEFQASDGPPVHDAAWSTVRRERVRAALLGLPEPQREALGLAYFGGYTQRQIAELTGLPLGTVKTRMLTGMRRMRTMLDGLNDSAPLTESAPAPTDPGASP